MKACTLRSLVFLALLGLAVPLYSQTPDELNPDADGPVNATAIQPDGKILVGGDLTTLGSQPRNRIGRLNPDGTLDAAFNPGANNTVYCLSVQEDGKIVVGGRFNMLGGQSCSYIGRLNSDGTLDATFQAGAGAVVYCLAVQANGKLLVGGDFTTLGGQSRSHIGRLNSDGTLDTSFNPGANYGVEALAIQPDGKILVGGSFTILAGQTRNRIGRLNADGTLDTAFDSRVGYAVSCLALQPDGKILVVGNFTTLCDQPRSYIGRLNSDGTLDTGFNPGPDRFPRSLAVQTDGKILVGGTFTALGGQPRTHFGQLNADGTLDPSFNQGTAEGLYQYVCSVTVQADGKVLVCGNFTSFAGQTRNRMVRLSNTSPAIQSLSCDATSITWVRGGTSPEVWRTSFDASTNGTDWVTLGDGTRIPGGWRLAGISVPVDVIVRARGYVTGGDFNRSSWFVEYVLSSPTLGSQPLSRTNSPGSVATFSVAAGGVAPLSYQWCKDGMVLAASENVSGVRTPNLTLSNVVHTDKGAYSVIITNSLGSITSLVATLTVLDPFIASQPLSQNANTGDTVEFSVMAFGTDPLAYQWRNNGAEVPGATSTSLALTNVQRSDAEAYDVLVSNEFGSVTSVVALLTVNLASADTFNPAANGPVYTTTIQTDGKFLVGGAFTTLGGQTRTNIGRLNSDGTLDSSFKPAANNPVDSLAAQADGKILVGGSFTTLCGQMRFNIGRLNGNGTLDTNFNPGASSPVYCLAPLPDGKILVGGNFITLGGKACTNVGRLNTDGTLDTTFRSGANGSVYSLAAQPDGKILIGGEFSTLGGQPRNRLGRLNEDGTLDLIFDPGASGSVSGLAVLANGRILVGGHFLTLGGQPRNYIGRLNADGSLDNAFNPGANDYVFSLAVQADGKIQVGGNFTILAGQARNRIGRLNNDDTLDLTFNPEASGCVYSLALQADGKTLVGGNFTTLAGQTRNSLGRLNDTEPAVQSLACDATKVTWLRGGSSPEVWRASLDASTNGNDWVTLGAAARIPGGWQLSAVSVPANATIRARGVATGGQYNRSSWLVETKILTSLPLILTQPIGQTNKLGADANFGVVAEGTPPLSYQWRKDGANIAGATAPTLSLTNIHESDQGGYDVVVDNPFGSVASSTALLVANQPPRSQFTSVILQLNGELKAQFCAPAGTICLVEASTDLVTWETIGLAQDQGDGTFAFGDLNAATFPCRYYRIHEMTGP